jgi:hypothetical protein
LLASNPSAYTPLVNMPEAPQRREPRFAWSSARVRAAVASAMWLAIAIFFYVGTPSDFRTRD